MISSAASRFSFFAIAHPGKFGHSPQSLIVQTGPGPQWTPGGHARSDAGILASMEDSPSIGDATGEASTPEVVGLALKFEW